MWRGREAREDVGEWGAPIERRGGIERFSESAVDVDGAGGVLERVKVGGGSSGAEEGGGAFRGEVDLKADEGGEDV